MCVFIVGICCDQGFNSTITATVEAPRLDQIRESKLGLHSSIKESLATLCSDPNTDVVILSGSKRDTLEEVPPLP
jgi:trehalose 6-phosphate synthase/phosphatase